MIDVGVVTIGRNEGERLRVNLRALKRLGVPAVYVDSRSSDGSPEFARQLGFEVVVLDESRPIGVPRARNEGFERLLECHPEIQYVQFIDGDCELQEGWLEAARAVLEERREVALVTGRRRERFRDRSVYNRLADMDWDGPIGEIQGSYGDFLIRVDAFRQVGGFDEGVLVSEDCDLCLRLRRRGWVLLRIDAELSLHDMAMERFSAWWKRTIRTGYGYADGAYLHGRSPDRWFVREVLSILFWGFVLPFVTLSLAWPTRGWSFLLLMGYLLFYWRRKRYAASRGWNPEDQKLFAIWMTLAVFPLCLGLFVYGSRLLRKAPKQIIEYKSIQPSNKNATRPSLETKTK